MVKNQLNAAYRRMKSQFKIHPPYGAVIADANIYSVSDYSEPIRSLAEAHPEAIYLTTGLSKRISKFQEKIAEELFAFIIGHEFYHFLDALMVLPEKQIISAKKLRLRKLHKNKLEQIADSFGIITARQAGYNPKIANIAKILNT